MLTPWIDVRRTFDRLDALHRSYERGLSPGHRTAYRWGFAPPAQAFRTVLHDGGEALTFAVEVPGIPESELKIDVTRESVTLSGARAVQVPEGFRAERQERDAVKFARTWALSVPVQPDGVTAQLKDGVLTITLPKASELRPRTIPVQTVRS